MQLHNIILEFCMRVDGVLHKTTLVPVIGMGKPHHKDILLHKLLYANCSKYNVKPLTFIKGYLKKCIL